LPKNLGYGHGDHDADALVGTPVMAVAMKALRDEAG
jgi:hypothetical protein